MQTSIQSIDEILAQAVEIAMPAERQSFIEQACSGSDELKREVARLVALYFRAGDFLELPVAEIGADWTLPLGTLDTRQNEAAGPEIPLTFLNPPNVPGSLGRIGA